MPYPFFIFSIRIFWTKIQKVWIFIQLFCLYRYLFPKKYAIIKEINSHEELCMPAIYTHARFGEEVLTVLPPHLASLAQKHKQCFYLGTQGPDLLFYHKPFKSKAKNPARKKGWDLHAVPPEDFFLRGAKCLLNDKSNFDEAGNFTPESADAAYLLGFLCHFTLDFTAHPYIDENSVDGLSHGKIESELDKHHFQKQGKKIRGFNTAKLFFPNEKAKKASAKILDVSEKESGRAMKTMRFINGLFSNKCGLAHGFCHAVLSLLGMNKNGFGDMFIHKKDDEKASAMMPTLDALFDEAVQRANLVITEFFKNIQSSAKNNALTNEIFRYNYSGIKED